MPPNDQIAYPLPHPTDFTKPFWDACQDQHLVVFACAGCEHLFLPGGSVCPKCWSTDLSVREVSGFGEVFSFVIYRRTYHPAIPAPYVVALIELKEGPRLISTVIGCAPEKVSIGMAVQIQFEAEDGFMLPRFTPQDSAPTHKV